MNVYIQLNDISCQNVIEQRLINAYEKNGENFWDNFFCCDKTHPDEKIIYLFTEYQIGFIWEWWKEKYEKGNIDVKKNLDYSRQKIFMTKIEASEKGICNGLNICCAKKENFNYKIIRVFLGIQPNYKLNKKYIDFFDGGFKYSQYKDLNEEECRNELIKLSESRRNIENQCHCSGGSNKKWLRYFGTEYEGLNFIDYCHLINKKCVLKIQKK
jgi:hypothetical protein